MEKVIDNFINHIEKKCGSASNEDIGRYIVHDDVAEALDMLSCIYIEALISGLISGMQIIFFDKHLSADDYAQHMPGIFFVEDKCNRSIIETIDDLAKTLRKKPDELYNQVFEQVGFDCKNDDPRWICRMANRIIEEDDFDEQDKRTAEEWLREHENDD